MMAYNKQKMLVGRKGTLAVIGTGEGQKFEKPLHFGCMQWLFKLLAFAGSNYCTLAVIGTGEGQKFEKPLHTSEMKMMINPEEEWKQLFTDAWRLERDYFYDAKMHGVDWNAMRTRYGKMLDGALTREEADFVIGEMIGELNASHTYHGGGDMEKTKNQN